MLKLIGILVLIAFSVQVITEHPAVFIVIGLLLTACFVLRKKSARREHPQVPEAETPRDHPKPPIEGYIVLDIETTGLSKTNDRIIEIAANAYQDGQLVSQFHTYVDPGIPIPKNITQLTGITDGNVSGAPDIASVKAELLSFLGDSLLVGHNIKSFDIPFLQTQMGVVIPNPLIDTLTMARKAFPNLSSYKLSDLDRELRLGGAQHHRAGNDILTTNALFCACLSPQFSPASRPITSAPTESASAEPYQEKFVIPYIWYNGKELNYIDVSFDSRFFRSIYLNRKEALFCSSVIKELGWSSDRQYRKLKTMDFVFCIPPKDYQRFLRCVRNAQEKYLESQAREEENRRRRIQLHQEPFTPDPVSMECVKCFCVATSSELNNHVSSGNQLVAKIADICTANGGRLYKTHAKSAKCAILTAPGERNLSSYQKYHEEGYIVVVPEDFLAFFGGNTLYTKEMAQRDFLSYISDL